MNWPFICFDYLCCRKRDISMTLQIKKLIALVLVFIFTINTSFYSVKAHAQQIPTESITTETSPLELGISQIENNSLVNVPNQKFDLFHLANQRIEIYNGQEAPTIYNLNEYQIELPTLAYTQLKVFYKK